MAAALPSSGTVADLQCCAKSAEAKGLSLGGGGYDFSGDFRPKGCYTYASGTYDGMAFFGTGGNIAEMDTDLAMPKVRVRCAVPETGPDSPPRLRWMSEVRRPMFCASRSRFPVAFVDVLEQPRGRWL